MDNKPSRIINETITASQILEYKRKKLPLDEIYYSPYNTTEQRQLSRYHLESNTSIIQEKETNQTSEYLTQNDNTIEVKTKTRFKRKKHNIDNKPLPTSLENSYNHYTSDNSEVFIEDYQLFKSNNNCKQNIKNYDPFYIENNIYDNNEEYAIEMLDIYKSFYNGKIKANQGISFKVKKNTVHALVGENGAGKSVLMSILFGIYKQDKGHIKINGKYVNISCANEASFYGLGMVHQHFKLVETNSIYENVILGVEEVNNLGIIKHKHSKEKVKELNQLYKFGLDINKKINKLNVAEQQKTEILKLLFRNSEILIFDEPTAVLSELEIKQFLDIIKILKSQGKTIILITHKFNEIEEVADHITVIRNGKYISDYPIHETNKNRMISDMVGNEISEVRNNSLSNYGPVVLDVDKLHLFGDYKDKVLNFKIHQGEIFAIAGVTGNGQTELALSMVGMNKSLKDKIYLDGKEISKLSIKNRILAGVASVPEDRHKHAIVMDMPTYLNVVLNKIEEKQFSCCGFIKTNSIKNYSRDFIQKHDIRGSNNGESLIRNLSGGNQQKLVVGREIDSEHKLLILVQPTRGLDVLAINNIHKMIMQEKEKGTAILLISYEIDEIMSLADTIAVMNKGSIVINKAANEITREEIGLAMLGGNK